MEYWVSRAELKRAKAKRESLEKAAKMYLKFGPLSNMDEEKGFEMFNDDLFSVHKYKSVPKADVKEFLRNEMEVSEFQDTVWNADFISGLTKIGEVKDVKKKFPCFRWVGNDFVAKILRGFPLYGDLNFDESSGKGIWSYVPALCLRSSESTISYLAGLISTAKEVMHQGQTYAELNSQIVDEVSKFGIPIEMVGLTPCISPFWILCLKEYLPEVVFEKWKDVKRPAMAETYSSVLFVVFFGSNIKTKALPFLPSKSKIYYLFPSESSLSETMRKKYIDLRLINISTSLKEVILGLVEKV